jgi:hypothetical protein
VREVTHLLRGEHAVGGIDPLDCFAEHGVSGRQIGSKHTLQWIKDLQEGREEDGRDDEATLISIPSRRHLTRRKPTRRSAS